MLLLNGAREIFFFERRLRASQLAPKSSRTEIANVKGKKTLTFDAHDVQILNHTTSKSFMCTYTHDWPPLNVFGYLCLSLSHFSVRTVSFKIFVSVLYLSV